MLQKLEKFLKENYIVIFIFLVSIILISGPFLISNNLEGFDAAGQYANAYYIRHAFWPWPGGWNSMLLLGFPQGIFYPPFFHWLSAALSFIIPLALAYKIILSLAVISFPLIYFRLAKNLFSQNALASAALLLAGVFYYFDLGLNDNLFCDLYFGMSPHLFSLTLFFIYLHYLWKLSKDHKKWQWPALFLALIIITHAITGLMSILFSLIALILSWNKKPIFIGIFKHLGLAAALSIWWWLPMIINLPYLSGSDISSEIAPILILTIPFIIATGLASLWTKSEHSLFLKTVAIFNIIILAFYLLSRVIAIDNFPLHSTRLLVYPLLLAPLSLVSLLPKKKINWQKINLTLLFVFSFYLFFFRIIPVGPFDTIILDNVSTYYKQGRVIVTGGSRYLDDRFHSTRMKLAIEHSTKVAEGLFVESSANGWFIMSMMKSWEKTVPTFVWAYKNLQEVDDVAWGSRILGINYEYRINDRKPSSEEKDLLEALTTPEKTEENNKPIDEIAQAEDYRNKNNLAFKAGRERLSDNERAISLLAGSNGAFYYQTFYQVNNVALAEALSLRPVNITEDWNGQTKKWWTSSWLKTDDKQFYQKPILVYQKETNQWQLANTDTQLPLLSSEEDMSTFVVDASSLVEKAPIYIKVSYFPFWQAFDEKGQRLEIHKASPNFMLVYGRGKITFKYVEPTYYYLGFALSGAALLFILLSLSLKRKK